MGEQRVRVALAPAGPRLPPGLALALDLPGLAAALLVLPARAALGRPALVLEPAAASAWGECFVGCAPATLAAPGRLRQGRRARRGACGLLRVACVPCCSDAWRACGCRRSWAVSCVTPGSRRVVCGNCVASQLQAGYRRTVGF